MFLQIQLSQQQLQMIRMQLQNNTSQPLILQAAPIQTAAQPQIIQVIEFLFLCFVFVCIFQCVLRFFKVTQQNAATQSVFIAQTNGNTESE